MATHMDRFQEMQIFTRIVERRSFTAAAEELRLPRAGVTNAIKRLEQRVGTRLLDRTTRVVAPTLDGQAYYTRCVRLLADLSEMENVFKRGDPAGLLRVSVHPSLAKQFVVPALPTFFDRYPSIELHILEVDRLADLVRDGVDCVLRVGAVPDSSMVAKQLTQLPLVTCASPTYLNRHGRPTTIEALERHQAINYMLPDCARAKPFEFVVDGVLRQITLPGALTVTTPDMYVANAIAGLGVIQLPRHRIDRELVDRKLEILLPHMASPPLPVYVLYPQSRQLSPRVRVFVDFLKEVFNGVD